MDCGEEREEKLERGMAMAEGVGPTRRPTEKVLPATIRAVWTNFWHWQGSPTCPEPYGQIKVIRTKNVRPTGRSDRAV